MSDPFDTLPGTLDAVWETLETGVADSAAPARHPVVASVRRGGGAEARIMVLRGADRSLSRLELQTDAASAKIAEVAEEPRGSLLVWDPAQNLQIRIRVAIRARTGPAAAAEWARVPEGARARYGGTTPGARIEGPVAAKSGADPARFAVLDLDVREIETLVIGEPHRRARFASGDGFAGGWIAP